MAEKEVKDSNKINVISESNNDNAFVYWVLPQILNMFLSALICVIVFLFDDKSVGFFIQSLLITLCLNALTGIAVRKFFPISVSVYADNNKRLSGFWIAYGCGLLISASCIMMPNAVWPFTGIFAVLACFGGPFSGGIGGLSLLVMSVLLSGENIGVLIIYLMCGLLAAILILPVEKKKNFLIPSAVSLVFLFVMISFGMAISNPDAISVYSFILPLINVLLSGSIMYVGLRNFYSSKIEVISDKYQVLNDISYKILAEEKVNNHDNYMIAIHTSHFCEIIASKLGLDREAMKCVGYYYRFCPTGEENRTAFLIDNDFPQKASMVLEEYTDFISKRSKGKVFTKECVVLVCAQTIVVTTLAMHSKNADLKPAEHIDKIVDATFDRYAEAETFTCSNITFKELQTIKELFKGEKLYYDFLCGK